MANELHSLVLPLRLHPLAGAGPRLAGCALVLGMALGGCGGDDSPSAAAGLIIEDQHNYQAVSVLNVPTIETAVGDLDICWDSVTNNLQCHDVAPEADINNVTLLHFRNFAKPQIEELLALGQVSLQDVRQYYEYLPQDSMCTTLADMVTVNEQPFEVAEDYVESAEDLYLLVLTKGTDPGIGAQTMVFIQPTASSATTEVNAPPGCGPDATLLDFSADLTSAVPLRIPADGPFGIDWKAVTADGHGQSIAVLIDQLIVGFYAGLTVADLEAQILDLELLTQDLWEITDLRGGVTTADLALARHRSTGEPFPGFSTDRQGVWAMALLCNSCQNPAPQILSILEPTATVP